MIFFLIWMANCYLLKIFFMMGVRLWVLVKARKTLPCVMSFVIIWQSHTQELSNGRRRKLKNETFRGHNFESGPDMTWLNYLSASMNLSEGCLLQAEPHIYPAFLQKWKINKTKKKNPPFWFDSSESLNSPVAGLAWRYPAELSSLWPSLEASALPSRDETMFL